MSYTLDRAGVELVVSFEGYVNGVYPDSRGFATCGYGHLLHSSAPTQADHREYDGRGRAFFLGLLHQDIQRDAIGPINQLIRAPLNQHQVDALASLTFNCGSGCLQGTVGREINAKRYSEAADAFLLWSHPSELHARREQERALFLTSVKPTVRLPWLQADERRWVEEYDHLHSHHENPGRQQVLLRVLTGRRKAIWHAAQDHGGWELRHRRQRYHSLRMRTEGVS
jgi:GH24 family phage-related lysozyme (muramidase)